MKTSKMVAVVHPDSKIRILLRSTLEAHGCTVATDHSCADLMTGDAGMRPNLILLDRSLLGDEGLEVLAQLNRKWEDAEIVFLPEGLRSEAVKASSISQLPGIIDRFLGMRTNSELLSI